MGVPFGWPLIDPNPKMRPIVQVAIVIADLAAWVLIMVVIGKWRAIVGGVKNLFSRGTSANSKA